MIRFNRRNALWTLSSLMVAFSFSSRPAIAATARPHEKIDAALHALDEANDELSHASDDFGGHKRDAARKIEVAKEALTTSRDRGGKKAEAVDKIEDAKSELQRCEEYKGPHDKEESAEKRHPKIHHAIEALEAAKEEL